MTMMMKMKMMMMMMINFFMKRHREKCELAGAVLRL